MVARGWHPGSWREMPIRQVPDYPDMAKLAEMEARLAKWPPLVFAGEARRLQRALAAAGDGQGFVLQGGVFVAPQFEIFGRFARFGRVEAAEDGVPALFARHRLTSHSGRYVRPSLRVDAGSIAPPVGPFRHAQRDSAAPEGPSAAASVAGVP